MNITAVKMNFIAFLMILITAMLSTTAKPIEKRELGGVSSVFVFSQLRSIPQPMPLF